MVSHLFFYQLALITLMWLFFLLFYAWPSERARRPPLAASITPPRPRSNAPKPFAGLPQKPSCALCEQDILSPQAPPAVRPDPIPPPHRRSRTVDTSQHFCPHTGCRYRGWLGLGNLRANGHPSGGPWRQFHCTACKGYFPEHHGTLFHGKQIAVELIVRVLACLAEDLGIRATARVFEINPNTVLQWLGKAVDQLQAFAHYFLCEIHVRQLQVDELYAVLKAMKAGDLSEDEAIRRLSPSPHWVWTAMDPETKLLLVSDVGTHTLAMAQRVLHQVAHCLAPDCVPLFLSDGCKDYLPAILTHFGCWSHPKRHHAKGPAPQPRWRPRPELLRHGLLRGSFIPSKPQRQLRELTRYRSTLVQDHARTLNRLQAVLEDANLKLASVVTDIYGVSARAMLAAILNGQRDVETLADLARGRLRAKRDQRTV